MSEEQADRAVALIAERVPAKRPELAEHLAEHGIPVEGQAIAHLVHRAAMRGRVALTPDRVFVALELGPPGDRDAALVRARPPLLRVPRRRHRRRPRLLVRPAGARRAPARGHPVIDAGPVPRVRLPAFDELLLGWRDRTPTVPRRTTPSAVHPGGGILRAVVLENGVAVGTWTRHQRASPLSKQK